MVIIPTEFYKENRNVKLTQQEIAQIIEELERVPHNIFVFFNYDKLIKKLKKSKKIK